MNFTFSLYEPEDGQYGSYNENTGWNGMIRELVEKKAEMAVSAMTVTPQRELHVDFTHRYRRMRKSGFSNVLFFDLDNCRVFSRFSLFSPIFRIFSLRLLSDTRNAPPNLAT